MSFNRRAFHAALLALALVGAQALGLAHRVLHGQAPPAQLGASAAAPTAGGTAFDAHEPGSIECRLLDQVAHADGLAATAWPALPPRVPAPAPAAAAVAAAAAPCHGYQARGPPGGLVRPRALARA